MNTAALQPGATVECNVRGRAFTATVTGKPAARFVDVLPLDKGITYRRLRANQVRDLLAPPPSPQLRMEGP